MQTRARIEYCLRAGLTGSSPVREGFVEARFDVNAAGRARRITMNADPSIPKQVVECAHTLIEKTKFESTHDYARDAVVRVEVPLKKEPPKQKR